MVERPTKRRGPMGWLAGRTWRFWWSAALFATVAVPALYVLSSGPALWLVRRVPQYEWREVYRTYSAPLGWACSKSPALNRAINWYSEFFVDPPPPIRP